MAPASEKTPSAPQVRTVLCDVGDVLIHFDPAVSVGIEADHGLEPGALLAATVRSPAARAAMAGAVDFANWREQTAAIVGQGALNDWLDYHGELDGAVVEIVKALRNRGVRVVLLSNATARLWDDLAHHGLEALVDGAYCSADIKAAKPERAAYEAVAHAEGFALDRSVLYVDDTASWAAAGQAAGMRALVFTGALELHSALCDLGIAR